MNELNVLDRGSGMNDYNANEAAEAVRFARPFERLVSFARSIGLSHRDIAKRMNELGLRTRTGCKWNRRSVHRLLARLDDSGASNVAAAIPPTSANDVDSKVDLFTRGSTDRDPVCKSESLKGDGAGENPVAAIAYVNSVNDRTRLSQSSSAKMWANLNQINIVREFQDVIKPHHSLPGLVDAAFFSIFDGCDIIVCDTGHLFTNRRFLQIAIPARDAGVRFLSADLRHVSCPLEVNLLFWDAVLDVGARWLEDPGGGRRDGSILADNETWALQFVPELKLANEQNWSDAEVASHLASVGKTKPAGYAFNAEDVRAMREIVNRLARDVFGPERRSGNGSEEMPNDEQEEQ